MSRLCLKKSKTSDHKKFQLTCGHGGDYWNSRAFFIDKMRKKKTSARCISLWFVIIQWHFLIKVDENDEVLAFLN